MVAATESIREGIDMSATASRQTRRRRFLKMLDVGILLATIAIFLLFLNVLIRIVFPEGARLGEIITDRESVFAADEIRAEVDLAGAGAIGGFVAHLGDIYRDVKIRPADAVAWSTARRGATVRNLDAVQTFAGSRARVDFTRDNELRISQNSLVVFQNGTTDPFLERRDPALVVLDGELGGVVNASYGSITVEFPAGTVELSSDDQSVNAVNFRIGINPDKSSTIAIYSGQADVIIAGQHYIVPSSHGLTVDSGGKSVGISALPALPSIRAPANNFVAKYLEAPPRIDFSWSAVPGAQSYRLEIAKDEKFDALIVDENRQVTSFRHANLGPGNYYWRVSARDGWALGPSSMTGRVRVVRDSQPPRLELAPIEPMIAGSYLLRGRTTGDAKVYVLGEPVETSANGNFEYLFTPEPGTQTIVVEAVDAIGNIGYGSQVLHVPGSSERSD